MAEARFGPSRASAYFERAIRASPRLKRALTLFGLNSRAVVQSRSASSFLFHRCKALSREIQETHTCLALDMQRHDLEGMSRLFGPRVQLQCNGQLLLGNRPL